MQPCDFLDTEKPYFSLKFEVRNYLEGKPGKVNAPSRDLNGRRSRQLWRLAHVGGCWQASVDVLIGDYTQGSASVRPRQYGPGALLRSAFGICKAS